jgi:hypothetical protein
MQAREFGDPVAAVAHWPPLTSAACMLSFGPDSSAIPGATELGSSRTQHFCLANCPSTPHSGTISRSLSTHSGPRLSWEQVLGRRLGRHCLLRPAPTAALVQVAADICGIHAQMAPSAELMLGLRVSSESPTGAGGAMRIPLRPGSG